MGWLFGKRGKTLFFSGCTSRKFMKEVDEDYRKILNHLEIGFVELDSSTCCGLSLFDAGFDKEARKLARKNFELFRGLGVTKIITSCPGCFKMFSEDYKELLMEWAIEVEHIVQTIAENLKEGDIEIKNDSVVTYHDPCYLARNAEIFEEPRKILKLVGFELKEMWHNRENTLCCGAGGLLALNNSVLANKISARRIDEAKNLGITKIITSCPTCVKKLSENSGNIEIENISTTIARALGIKYKKQKNDEEGS